MIMPGHLTSLYEMQVAGASGSLLDPPNVAALQAEINFFRKALEDAREELTILHQRVRELTNSNERWIMRNSKLNRRLDYIAHAVVIAATGKLDEKLEDDINENHEEDEYESI